MLILANITIGNTQAKTKTNQKTKSNFFFKLKAILELSLLHYKNINSK